MKFLVVTQYFDPEEFQSNLLVEALLNLGHRVDVIAPTPSYPEIDILGQREERLDRSYLRKIRIEVPPRNKTSCSKVLNSLSFAIRGSIRAWEQVNKESYDRLIVFQYSPVTCIIPGVIAARQRKCRSMIWIFDAWPESLEVLTKERLIGQCLFRLARNLIMWSYKCFDVIGVSSDAFTNIEVLKDNKKVVVVRTWEREFQGGAKVRRRSLDSLRICSIGNIGAPHDVELIVRMIDASEELRKENREIKWVFAGHGRGMDRIKEEVKKSNIEWVEFVGLVSKEECSKICREADISLIPFKQTAVSDTIPFRTVTSVAVGTPLLSFGFTHTSKLVIEYGCGKVINSGSTKENCKAVLTRLYEEQDVLQTEMSENAMRVYERLFSETTALSQLRKVGMV